ncbi:MAG: hypothetical protein WBG96_14600, partial [Thermoanaerobaculia bacterium]
ENSSIFQAATLLCLAVVLPAGSGAFGQSAPEYEVVDLTVLVGANEGEAYDVNDLGEIVMKLELSGDTDGYVWSEAKGLQVLTDDGWHHLQPRAINNRGIVTGLGSTKDPWGLPAFVRTPDGSVSQLNSQVAGSENSSYGYGLNEAGWAVGGGPATGSFAAFLWRPPGYTTGAVLSGTAYQAMARDANDRVLDDGQPAPVVVGSLRRPWEKYTSAVCWGCAGNLEPLNLGELDPATATDREANGVNDRNHIVGSSCAAGSCKAFRWTPADEMTELPGLLGSSSTSAEDINEADWVAGTSQRDGTDRAVVWSPTGQVFELENLSGALSSVAHAVNESGWVVGRTRICIEELDRGCLEEVDHATLWRPLFTPPPTPAELIVELALEVKALYAAGILDHRQANSLLGRLWAAHKKIETGQPLVPARQLRATLNEVQAMLRSGLLTPEKAELLLDLTQEAIAGLIGDESG